MTSSDNNEQVFELTPNEESTAKAGGGILRVFLYGFIIVLFGGIAAVQAKPELSEYLAFLPSMNSASAKHAPLPCCAAKASCTASTSCCESADTCMSEESVIATRPPAPAMPEELDVTL